MTNKDILSRAQYEIIQRESTIESIFDDMDLIADLTELKIKYKEN